MTTFGVLLVSKDLIISRCLESFGSIEVSASNIDHDSEN